MTGGGPLRVGLVCPYDIDVPGGVRAQVLGLARGLLAAGHQAEVLAPGRTPASHRRTVEGVRTVSTGRAVPVLANGSTARLGLGPRARRAAIAWVRAGAFDVLHVHEPIPPGIGHAVLDACRWLPEARRPAVVVTVHVAMSPAPAGRSRALRLVATGLRRRLDEVAVLTAVSDHARRTVVDHLGRDPVVLPNGLDVGAWSTVAPSALIEPSPPRQPRSPSVVVLGRADEPRKGVGVLLRAWPEVRRRCPDARLLVVGPAGRRPHGDLRDDGVRFVGAVDEATKVRLVAGADVLVAPHLGGESFGIVLAEAMAAGTPVVAAALPAFRDVLADTGLLVPPGRPGPLADAVADLLTDEPLALRLSVAAGHRVQDFDFTVLVARTVELYRVATLAPRGVVVLRAELDRALHERALAAGRAAGRLERHGEPGAALLAEAVGAATGTSDLRAHSRLSAVLRCVPAAGSDQEVVRAGARVRLLRGVLNDRVRGLGHTGSTVELDDDGSTGHLPGASAGAADTAHLPSPR